MRVGLGDKVKDSITGFTGIVIAEHKYLNGCVRVSIQPEDVREGKPIEACAFDVEQITLIEPKKHPTLTPTGGPEKTPARPSVPTR